MGAENLPELKPTLDRAKATLKTALDEACGVNVDRADTGELIRVEEMLAIANEAAKEVVSVRRRAREHPTAAGAAGAAGAAAAAGDPITSGGSRELEDENGVRWAVFAVHPSLDAGRLAMHHRLRSGWLTFASEAETRRLAPIPDGWQTMSDSDLLSLSSKAEAAPRRA